MYLGEHGGYKVLVMENLGPTLQQMKQLNKNKKLPGKSILKIAAQLVSIQSSFLCTGKSLIDDSTHG